MIFDELDSLCAAVDERVGALDFDCRRCGDCCRFHESGIRLYLSTLEACRLFGWEPDPDIAPPDRDPAGPGSAGCPFQEGDSCGRRRERTLGCRVYLCDPSLDGEIGAIYEEFHERVRLLHEKHGIPYHYHDVRDWARIAGRAGTRRDLD